MEEIAEELGRSQENESYINAFVGELLVNSYN